MFAKVFFFHQGLQGLIRFRTIVEQLSSNSDVIFREQAKTPSKAFDEYITFCIVDFSYIDLRGPEGPHYLRQGQSMSSRSYPKPLVGFS